jgi:hypothetical protein
MPKPGFPLFALVHKNPSLEESDIPELSEDVFRPLAVYEHLYVNRGASYMPELTAYAKQHQPDTKIVAYINAYNTKSTSVSMVEREHIDGIAMLDIAALAMDIDASSNQVTVRNALDGDLPILASTADVSSTTEQFCFWIQVDDERMKVLEVDKASGRLRVQRGFRSSATSHRAGAIVFSPVYMGFRNKNPILSARSTQNFPYAGNGNKIAYMLDPGSPGTQDIKAQEVIALQQRGLHGPWQDNFRLSHFNMCDPMGRRIQYFWNFSEGRRYTDAEMVDALLQHLAGIRQRVQAETGMVPFLAANSASGDFDRGNKLLFRSDRSPRGLDAYDFEDSFISPSLRGATQAEGFTFHPLPADKWLKSLTMLKEVARENLPGIAMIGPAGYVAPYFNPDQPNYEALMRFSWCSFLLTVTRNHSLYFGMQAVLQQQEDRFAFIDPPEYMFFRTGEPLEDLNIEACRIGSSGVYARRFEHAVVFVNPDEIVHSVSLDNDLGDVAAALGENTLQLAGGDGKIVMMRR